VSTTWAEVDAQLFALIMQTDRALHVESRKFAMTVLVARLEALREARELLAQLDTRRNER
jgi:hypothetical protein